MKTVLKGLFLAAACLVCGACVGSRRIYRVSGCNTRLANREKRIDCRACVTRPRPHVFLPDLPSGDRCALR